VSGNASELHGCSGVKRSDRHDGQAGNRRSSGPVQADSGIRRMRARLLTDQKVGGRGGARPWPVASTSPRHGPRECRRWETSWSRAPPPVIGGRLPPDGWDASPAECRRTLAAHCQSFRIEVPCNISCNISRRIGVSAGQSRRLTARCHSLENDKTAGQEPLDLRLSWWPGAGSNRRPSDFQSDARTN
jgi:hypothetical protein